MPLPHSTVARTRAEHLLYAHWKPAAVAYEIRAGRTTIYKWQERLQMYRQIDNPTTLPGGRPRRVTTAAKEWLLEYQSRKPWAYQDELAIALEEEWDITVSQPTICRILKENRISYTRGAAHVRYSSGST